MQISTLSNIISLWKYLGKKRQLQFFFLFILMIVSVFAEVISIGAVVPFLSALTNPEILMKLDWFKPILDILNIKSTNDLLLPLTLGFVVATIFAGGLRILLLWVNMRLSVNMGIKLRKEIFSKTLHQPYEFQIENNSSQLVSLVTQKVGVAIQVGIMHVLIFMSASLSAFSIIITLLMINVFVAILAFAILGGGYILMGYFVRKQLKINGDTIAMNQPDAIKCIQEGLGGIRDIIVDNTQEVFVKQYTGIATKIQLAATKNSFLGDLPKSLLEMVSITLIAILAYYLQNGDNQREQVLPILGALALGAQRLLPALQQIYFSWSTINGNQAILSEVITHLEYPSHYNIGDNKSVIPLSFNNNIILKNVEFRYRNSETNVLHDVNLEISKGMKVGFIGMTGSGKSTLLDIIMGLLPHSGGKIKIDGVNLDRRNITNWQKHIAHVPQSIFLSDASMAENIAFGITLDEINMIKVKEAAKQASLDSFIHELPSGYRTSVGERGVQLSGGQRQRIGIARALYKQATVIIFDEATSALDNATEVNVMESINALDDNLTILIIAHRLSTLKDCDVIYKLDKGTIVASGTYDKMVRE